MDKNEKQNKKNVTYVTLADNCTQDMYIDLCIFNHALSQIKEDFFPNATKVVDCNGAKYYAILNVIACKAATTLEMRIEIIENEFNEHSMAKINAAKTLLS